MPRDKSFKGMYGGGDIYGASTLALMSSMLLMAQEGRKKRSDLPKEERERIERERLKVEEATRVARVLMSGKCPGCNAKVIRGKKDKKMDYKRKFTCPKCENVYHR